MNGITYLDFIEMISIEKELYLVLQDRQDLEEGTNLGLVEQI